MKIIVYLYKVTDSHGYECAVSSDSPNCFPVQLWGLKDENGSNLYFESEPSNIALWCEENNLKLTTKEVELNI